MRLVVPVRRQDGVGVRFLRPPAVRLQEVEEIRSADGVEQLAEEEVVLQQTSFF